jgi:uncharacterized membrane protein
VGNATIHGMDYFNIRWLAWGYWLFMISGVLWVAVLIPVQTWQAKLARGFAQEGEIPDVYWKLGRVWLVVGVVATLIPLANIYWMVSSRPEHGLSGA